MHIGFDLNGDGKVDKSEEYLSYKMWEETVEKDQKAEKKNYEFQKEQNTESKGWTVSTVLLVIGIIWLLYELIVG